MSRGPRGSQVILNKITSYATLAVAVVASAGFAYLLWQNGRMSDKLKLTRSELASAEASLAAQKVALDQALEAQDTLQSHLDRSEADIERWRATGLELGKLEGADEVLNPYERAVLDSLLSP